MSALVLLLVGALLSLDASQRVEPQMPAAATAQGGPACALMTSGQTAFDEGHFREAADLFARAEQDSVATQDTCSTDAAYRQAQALERLERLSDAESALRRFLVRSPRSASALFLLGSVLQRENKPKESLEVFTHAAALQPPTPDQLRVVALDYVLLDDYFDALHWLRRAVASDPRNPLALYDLGRAEMHEGDFVHAEEHFKQSLALNPHNVRALDNLGLSYEAQNRGEDALNAYAKAIALQAGDPHPSEQPLLNFGTLLITRNRASEAIPILSRAVEIAPSSSHCVEELARAYRFSGQDVLSVATMERAVALDGSNPRLHFQLGQMYRHAGRVQEAKREFKTSSELYGQHSTPDRP